MNRNKKSIVYRCVFYGTPPDMFNSWSDWINKVIKPTGVCVSGVTFKRISYEKA